MGSDPDYLRRRFLARSLALGAAAFLAPVAAHAAARVRFESDPFSLGVASGSPRPDGVVIWTRLAPRPLEGGGMGTDAVEVRWEMAADDTFRKIVRQGRVTAGPDAAHCVHVEVDGLEPARDYFYRFIAGEEASGVARTRTSPAPGHGDERLRLALASCQQFEQGYFVAHRHLAEEGADLVAFVGDYIYESSWGRDHVRKHATGEPHTLDEYRARYAQYKTDRDLQRCHASAPWIVTWDDHEVDNDYADDRSEDLDPNFLARRSAAYRAFLEHMPLRPSVLQANGGMRIYDRYPWGALALLHVLDDRQYRSWQPCAKPLRGGSNVVGTACTQRLDPAHTLLGADQERWLDAGLAGSAAGWNVIVQQTLMAPAGRTGSKGGIVHWTDGWDGYPAARARLIDNLVETKARNPVVLGGDVHANYVAELHRQPEDDASPIVASEFCGTSITSQGPRADHIASIAANNAHILLADGEHRGYTMLDFTPRRLEARLRVVDTVKSRRAEVSTLATFTVEDGRPGPRRQ